MNAGSIRRWDALAERLPTLLAQLCAAEPVLLGMRPAVPAKAGVYLFTEAGAHVYVGQTRNLRRRLTQHSGNWAKENQATFAFGRARAEALKTTSLAGLRTRRALASHSDFEVIFAQARRAVAAMDVRFVEVDDPELRTVFEVYATVLLGTENSFETH